MQEGAEEGMCRLQESAWSPPLRSKSRAKHFPSAWICCCSGFCSHLVGRILLTSSAEEAQVGRVALNLICCRWPELRGLKGEKEPTAETWAHAGTERGPSVPGQGSWLREISGEPELAPGLGRKQRG